MDHLDARYVSLGPDTGHIVRGGQDLLACLGTYISRITHLHLKDVTATGEWVALGQGVCDFPAVLALLESVDYGGWIVGEEESDAARQDGLEAIRKNRAYLRGMGY
jgi:sugar phosphate isomerase/epimerase